MIGVAALLAAVAQPMAFERQENIAAAPAPMQAVDLRV